ncbi:class I adenylate-forming enzyme family protein [Aquicella lusitana]|uniref:Long-chain acyl-CoA synthetase n=1 Tax=Aquicella lusitana TaxID=254246 RepID=A0A370GD44_9COXI|nr:fatty acid--CoA ligase family protein [Aquicella lusitana]RDI40989.1 long-chain acyl-CoA synthetase [Aquicella lusitana]VVC73606.1 Long-chain-fatty-acid--CoA ligase [Aquicella lusitana]
MLQNTLVKLAALKEAHLIYESNIITAVQLVSRTAEIIAQLRDAKNPLKSIAFYLPNSPELICWQLACFHLGIMIVPIIYEHEPAYVEKVLHLTAPSLLMTTSNKGNQLSQMPCPVQMNDDRYDAVLTAKPITNLPHSTVSAEQTAMIIFSSGSTGTLKGIMHSYQSAYEFIQLLAEVLDAGKNLVYLVAQPMGHIGGITTTLLALLHDGQAILLEQFNCESYINAMARYQPTHINLHTPLFYELLHLPDLDKRAFSRIQSCFAGGDDIPRQLPAQFTAKTGAPMRIGYGMTEIGIVIVNKNPYGLHAGSSGRTIPQAMVELRDEHGKRVVQGEVGEIWVKSPACCKGYWQMPDLNQRSFDNGWFRTGDLASEDKEGYFWFKGRASQVIHSDNHIIYPQVIEQILFDCSAVKSAAVIAINDNLSNEIPVAFVELTHYHAHHEHVHDALMRILASELAAWEMPRKLFILDKMPLNTTGKIDRIALKKLTGE